VLAGSVHVQNGTKVTWHYTQHVKHRVSSDFRGISRVYWDRAVFKCDYVQLRSVTFPTFKSCKTCADDGGKTLNNFCSCFLPVCIPRCNSYRVVSPLDTLPPPPTENRMGEYFTSGLFCLQRKHLAFVSVSGRGYPGKVIMWQFFHLLSTSQYSSRSHHSGHACCYTIMNHLERHLLCASNRYWCRCFQHQGSFYWISYLLCISLRLVPTLLICPAWETLLVAMLPPAYLSGSLQLTSHSTTARWRYQQRSFFRYVDANKIVFPRNVSIISAKQLLGHPVYTDTRRPFIWGEEHCSMDLLG
jgi:hypothetical protein